MGFMSRIKSLSTVTPHDCRTPVSASLSAISERPILSGGSSIRSARPPSSDLIHVQNQIFVDRDTPRLQNAGQRVVVCDFGAAHLERGIEHKERAAAVFRSDSCPESNLCRP